MKLSHITLSLLIISATAMNAQQDKNKVKIDTTKKQKTAKLSIKDKRLVKDSTMRVQPVNRNCGPCGMG